MKDSYMWYTDKLSEEYKTVFEQIELYVSAQNIDSGTSEERLGDLLDVFLSAQDSGKPVQKIVGNDLETFCKTFCSDFGVKNHILHVVVWVRSIAMLLAVISTLDILYAVGGNDFHLGDNVGSLNVSIYLVMIVISGALAATINIIVRKIMFKTKRISVKTLQMVPVVAGVAVFIITMLLLLKSNSELFHVPAWIVAFCSWAYLFFYNLLIGKKMREKEKQQPKVNFMDMVIEDVQGGLDSEMEKKFQKKKRAYLTKYKKELSFEEFLDSEEKSCNNTEKLGFLNYLLPIVLTAIIYMAIYFTNGFETQADSVFFVIIMLAVEYLVFIGFGQIEKNGVEERRAWISMKRNEMKGVE